MLEEYLLWGDRGECPDENEDFVEEEEEGARRSGMLRGGTGMAGRLK